MKYVAILVAVVVFMTLSRVNAQDPVKSDVHLFQNFLRDGSISQAGYAEGGLSYGDFDGGSIFTIGAQGGYPINPQFELAGGLEFRNFSPDNGDGESGLADIPVTGRYLVYQDKTHISVGGYATLPVGKDELGEGTFDFGAFGALRHPLQNGMVITGVVGIDFIEVKTFDVQFDPNTLQVVTTESSDREAAILVGGGFIYPGSENFNIVGELVIQTEVDYAMISAGADYALKGGSKVRGGLGIGLDDGAPDVMLMGSFMFYIRQ
jgi:hypothetical protein